MYLFSLNMFFSYRLLIVGAETFWIISKLKRRTRKRKAGREFHNTFSYIFSLSILTENLWWDIFERSCWSWKSPSNRQSHKLLGNFSAAFEILGNFCDFRPLLKFLASFGLNYFLFFLRHLLAIEKKKTSAKFKWFILLSECVDSRTGPITNATLVLHACPWGKRYHMI